MDTHRGPDDRLTPAEVAARAFVDPKTVGRWARAGKIPFELTPGGHRRFRSSDVDALLDRTSGRVLRDRPGHPWPEEHGMDRVRAPMAGAIQGAAADAVVAEATAIAMEARANAAAEAVLDIEMAVAVAAETARTAAIEASRARAIAAAEAARVVAHEAATAAAEIRSRAVVNAEHLAAAAHRAKGLVSSSDTEAQTSAAAVRMAATVEAAAETALSEASHAAVRVAEAVTHAAAHVAELVADFDLALERETASTARALKSAVLATARQVARTHGAAMAGTPSNDVTRALARGHGARYSTLAAEIQQRVLPPSRACATTAFTLAAWLEAAATGGGDAYDYSLADDVLHFSLTDAAGHGVDAALAATVCRAGLRGSRRADATVEQEVQAANAALCNNVRPGDGSGVVTGLVGRVDLASGVLEIVNAGHELPLLLRSGVVSALDVRLGAPLGTLAGATYTATQIALVPGDRIILVTSGVLERGTGHEDLSASVRSTQGHPSGETVREIADAASARAGHDLVDDATVLCLDWYGTA